MAVWPAPKPRSWSSWRGARKARIERRKALLLPPLFGSGKSGARYDRGTWQFWVVHLPLSPLFASVVFSHQARRHVAVLGLVGFAAGLDAALTEKRRPGSFARQAGRMLVTAGVGALAVIGIGQIVHGHHWLVGGGCIVFGVAALAYRWVANRLADRSLDEHQLGGITVSSTQR